jgi:hypothetical protein
MGEAARIHPSMPSPQDGELAGAPELIQWLTPMSKGHLDAAASGAFLSLTTDRTIALIKKMVANQS